MPLILICPNRACHHTLSIGDNLLGRKIRCRHCRHTFVASIDAVDTATQQVTPASTPAPARANSPRTPTGIDRFQILKELGQGAFGIVYQARDPRLHRDVAVKVPRAGVLANPVVAERFLREARAAARLRHPAIVPVFEAGEANGTYYIASAYVPGHSLSSQIPDNGMECRRAARIVQELAEAAAYAHEQGIVHRDIKPQNVILDEKDHPHLLDFGLAARQDESEKLTRDGAVLGTPAYMAPEQAEGRLGEVQPAVDQYSLGVVLYELLTGKTPFNGTPVVVLFHVKHTDPPPLRKLQPAIPRDLEVLCLKAMAKRESDRYTDCQEFADDLRRWREGEPIRARRATAIERLARWIQRNPSLAVAIALAILVPFLGGLAAASMSLWRQAEVSRGMAEDARELAVHERRMAETARGQAEAEKERAEIAQAQAEVAKSEAISARDQLRTARDQLARIEYGRTMLLAQQEIRERNIPEVARLIAGASPDLRGWEWNYLGRLTLTRTRSIVKEAGMLVATAVSPDETRGITAAKDGTVRIWDLTNGRVVHTLFGHRGTVNAVAFSSDSKRVVTAGADQTARVWDAETGKEGVVFTGHTGAITSVAFHPDGAQVVTGGTDRAIRLWDTKTGNEVDRWIDESVSAAGVTAVAFHPLGTHVVIGREDNTIRVWKTTAHGERIRALPVEAKATAVKCVAYSSDGTRIVTSGADLKARVWDAESGKEQFLISGHTGAVTAAAFHPENIRIVTASTDGTVRVWNASNGAEMFVLAGHIGPVVTARFSADGKRILTSGIDGFLGMWDLTPKPEARSWTPFPRESAPPVGVFAAAFSADGTRVALGGGENSPSSGEVWDVATGRQRFTLNAPPPHGKLYSVAYSSDGTRILTGGYGGINLWNAETGNPVRTLLSTPSSPDFERIPHRWDYATAFSSDGKRVVGAEPHGTYLGRVWDATTGAQLCTLKGHTGPITSVAFSPDGTRILTGGADKSFRLWNATTGKGEWSVQTLTDAVRSVAFHPDGTRVLIGCADKTARVYQTDTPDEILVLRGHRGAVTSVAYNPNGTRILTGSVDQTARLWDSLGGGTVLILQGHAEPITTATFNRAGSRILTASSDGTIRLWE